MLGVVLFVGSRRLIDGDFRDDRGRFSEVFHRFRSRFRVVGRVFRVAAGVVDVVRVFPRHFQGFRHTVLLHIVKVVVVEGRVEIAVQVLADLGVLRVLGRQVDIFGDAGRRWNVHAGRLNRFVVGELPHGGVDHTAVHARRYFLTIADLPLLHILFRLLIHFAFLH